jgi:hypothetical protein
MRSLTIDTGRAIITICDVVILYHHGGFIEAILKLSKLRLGLRLNRDNVPATANNTAFTALRMKQLKKILLLLLLLFRFLFSLLSNETTALHGTIETSSSLGLSSSHGDYGYHYRCDCGLIGGGSGL